jgi:hypothetical protein
LLWRTSLSEAEAIESLTLLVERYEQAHYPILLLIRYRLCGFSLSKTAPHAT